MERTLCRSLILAAIAVWVAAAGIRWASAPPLGHDEARYALSGRHLLAHELPRWDYVPPGVAAIAVPGLLAGGSERALRLLPLLIDLGFLAAAWALARRFSRETAAWTVAVLAGTLPVVRLASDLLSDLPSAALLVAALAVLVGELSRDGGLRRRIVVAAPLCALAFYIRYGSVVPIALVGLVTAIAGARAIAARPWPVVATALLFAVLLVPHVVQSRAMDGSALGIMHASAAMPAPGRGLLTYLTHPWLYGVLGGPLILAALAGARRDRWRTALTAIAIGQIVVLGLQTQAQPRYVFVATALLVIAGVDTLRDVLARHWRVAVVAVAATWVAVLVSAVGSGPELRREAAATLAAAEAIHADAAGRPCLVMGRHRMQLEWYSGCAATMGPPPQLPRFYAVRDDSGGADQPDLAAQPGTHAVVLHRPDVDVIRCDPR